LRNKKSDRKEAGGALNRVPRRGTRRSEANHLSGGGEAEAEGLSEGTSEGKDIY